ncbi:Rhodanese-related sulfurtransferase [Clostridium cavendishii DSM 21758]|uniref:Rhodanese-related sulfurtransferase n=1 Tax=Clostridium cavendishii DSM 21758 TaxID=1121302 RepID=A0A1M6T6K5_9CLOT|nr:rhodanese-like domain-containing protein [Clostridium cavendishii]SHK52627.1 Rhodanese-related sulfurtransferase [Clostridium cavendishii DSM 21758]
MSTVINVSPQEAHGLIFQKQVVVLDVRDNFEFNSGHIPRAINIPVSKLDSIIDNKIPNKNTPILVHCFAGSRSPIAVNILLNHGYQNIYHLTGGINSWQYGIV